MNHHHAEEQRRCNSKLARRSSNCWDRCWTGTYRDLKGEIRDTDAAAYKHALKEREAVLVGLLHKLGHPNTAPLPERPPIGCIGSSDPAPNRSMKTRALCRTAKAFCPSTVASPKVMCIPMACAGP